MPKAKNQMPKTKQTVLNFLNDLKQNNKRKWFYEKNKFRYEEAKTNWKNSKNITF